MPTDVEKLACGDYRFLLEQKSGATPLGNYLTVWAVQEAEFFLRDFYFAEADALSVRAFCHRFARDTAYRQQVLAGHTRWARRNALFTRNLLPLLGSNPSNAHERACAFFHLLDANLETILALPAYQHLQALDNAFQLAPAGLDPFIQPAVKMLDRVPGITTRFSCQGVSGKVLFQNYDLLTISPHEEFAFVSFSSLEPPVYAAITSLLPLFPSITNAPLPHSSNNLPVLRSTGNNLRFRADLLELARHLLPEGRDKAMKL